MLIFCLCAVFWSLRNCIKKTDFSVKKSTPQEIHFIYLDSREIYCIFNTWCIIGILFSTQCHVFQNLSFFGSNNTHSYALQFKYQPSCLKVISSMNWPCVAVIFPLRYVMVMLQMLLLEVDYVILSARDVLIMLP